ncbi:MAG: Aminotransferase class V [Limisphaerales bacterium]|nr:MAG: Aminotransferase class V [Limisphaerales bacterium]KAG0506777.1 MAG: Aminotransferase class V [Limisphaerales bacterium]TXT49237.1 MAG: Aminotransferase class V [Limisphaerales bacterium]
MLYFDHNATSPLHPAARQAWLDATERFIGNPSSLHRVGARADAALSEAREKLAAFLGCHALDLVFTSGATESANTVFHHAARTLPPDAEVWLSAIEHPCVIEAARYHFPKRHRLIPVTRDGVVDLDWLAKKLKRARPGLLAVMAVNNETGVIQPTREALALCRAHGIPFFCDAVQAIGKLPAAGLGDCDWASGSAHKFGGPRGVGFLKCPAKGRVAPLLRGGMQEEGRRAGTENVPGVLAMVAALNAREQAARAGAQVSNLRVQFEHQLLKALPGSAIIAAESPRVWNTVLALMPEADCRTRWVVKLDKLGVAVSTGSACASGKEEPSPVLTAMGYSPVEAARALRFSAGWESTEADWHQLLAALVQAHREMQPAPRSRRL